jgi:hypothetical protein
MPFLRTGFQDTEDPSHALDIKVVPGNTINYGQREKNKH